MLLLLLYLIIGAICFRQLDPQLAEVAFTELLLFCFETLATIGRNLELLHAKIPSISSKKVTVIFAPCRQRHASSQWSTPCWALPYACWCWPIWANTLPRPMPSLSGHYGTKQYPKINNPNLKHPFWRDSLARSAQPGCHCLCCSYSSCSAFSSQICL